tara:strand:- start:1152 stop:1592 length:441 start_codon:yes stop_codon:yes gene_type:complete
MTQAKYIDEFIIEYCNRTCTTMSELKSKARKRDIVEKRMVAAYVLRNQVGMPLMQIGEYFNKHHASIIHYIKLTEDFIDVYPHIKRIYITAEEVYELYKEKLRVSYVAPETLAEKEDSLIEILLNNNQELVRKINKLQRKLHDYEN